MRWFATLLAVSAISAGCSRGSGCELGDHVDIPSPDQSLNAWIYSLECDSGEGSTWNVSILPAAERLAAEPGNALETSREQSLLVLWPESTTLQIEVDFPESVESANEVDGVQIDVRAHSRPAV